MRYSPLALAIAIVALSFAPSLATAQEASAVERMAARRELAEARLALQLYWQVEYPRIRRHLNAQIEIVEREIKDYKERLRAFDPFNRFGSDSGDPFLYSRQNLKMCLLEAELRRDDLYAERNALIRFHSADFRALEQKVYEARLRVAALEATEEPAAEPLARNK